MNPSNPTHYINCEATLVSNKYAKALFVIDGELVSKFEEYGVKPKAKVYDEKTTFAVSAKLQSDQINELYKSMKLGELTIGAKYEVMFKIYPWRYNGETGTGCGAFVKQLVSPPEKKEYIDTTIVSFLSAK